MTFYVSIHAPFNVSTLRYICPLIHRLCFNLHSLWLWYCGTDLLRFKSELEDYKKEKGEMRRVKALLVGVEEEYTAIVWEHETLSQRFAGNPIFLISANYPISLISAIPILTCVDQIWLACRTENGTWRIATKFPCQCLRCQAEEYLS